MIAISKYSNTIEYNLRTTLDRSGLTQLQTELNKVSVQLKEMQSRDIIDNTQVSAAINNIQKFQKALNSSFNTKIGMLDMTKLTSQLNDSGLSLRNLQNSFSMAGSTGKIAFTDVLAQLGKIDTGIKSTSSMVDKIFNTMGNTVRWGIMSSAFNGVTDSIRQSVEYAKDLDDSLTQIMLVTDYSRDSMVQYAKQANEAAKALGSTTTAMTNASLVYTQQGFDLNKSQQLAEMSTKLANASQQDTATASDQITAYMNAYGLDNNIEKLHGQLGGNLNDYIIGTIDGGNYNSVDTDMAEVAKRLLSVNKKLSFDVINAKLHFDTNTNFDYISGSESERIKEIISDGEQLIVKLEDIVYQYKETVNGYDVYESDSFIISFRVKIPYGKRGQLKFGENNEEQSIILYNL